MQLEIIARQSDVLGSLIVNGLKISANETVIPGGRLNITMYRTGYQHVHLGYVYPGNRNPEVTNLNEPKISADNVVYCPMCYLGFLALEDNP